MSTSKSYSFKTLKLSNQIVSIQTQTLYMNNHPFKTFLLHRNRAPYIILTTEEKCSKFKFMLVEKKMIFSSTDMQLGAKTASFWTIISYNFVSQKGLCYIRVFLCPFSFVSNQHPEQQKKNFSKNNKTEYPDEDALQKTDRKRTKVALWSHKWAEMSFFHCLMPNFL